MTKSIHRLYRTVVRRKQYRQNTVNASDEFLVNFRDETCIVPYKEIRQDALIYKSMNNKGPIHKGRKSFYRP